MNGTARHAKWEWLSFLDVSGPFLAEPVLNQVFPQGLDQIEPQKQKDVRQAYDEWREAVDQNDSKLSAIHAAWINLVLKQTLGLGEDGDKVTLKPQAKLSEKLSHEIPEHSITLLPDFAVVNGQSDDRPLLLIRTYSPKTELDVPMKGDGWATSLAERMVELCRACDARLGLVTNGEQWVLIDAPVGGVTTSASWHARLWGQEPTTLQAFVNLLGGHRFNFDPSDQLPALLDNSLEFQDEVTDALGKQVSRAVEVLIQALDRADVDRERKLLSDVEPSELYAGVLTVMMRIVFLLSAEERELLLMGDDRYEANYAVSTLRRKLQAESDEILERRWDAWSRLLSVFRAVYGGIEHEALRLPALGGSLFDPDRFPFLEGREQSSDWKVKPSTPLPINNRTVLLLLDAVQLFQGRMLSYRALDVEQIGYVYEGLLELTAVRSRKVTLKLDATKNAKKPWVTLDELDAAAEKGGQEVEALLADRSGSLPTRVKNDLAKKADAAAADKLLTACNGDQTLRDRIKPYFHLLRMDQWGYPLVHPARAFMVATGTERRETGTHYTPKSLTKKIVTETLEPIVYTGPADGKQRKDWILKTPAEVLDLKICDLAMGSGAFLVQVCLWLSERLVEAWEQSEAGGDAVTSKGIVVKKLNGCEPLRNDAEERLLTAKRLIAEQCLYGVDVNPLAVELTKLSLWLVTLAKGLPFGFLNHNLRSGDSLLGIHNLDQLHYLNMKPGKGCSKKLFAQKIKQAVKEAINLRSNLRSRPSRDIQDVEFMAHLDTQARQTLKLPELIADALVGETLAARDKHVDTTELSIEAGRAMEGRTGEFKALQQHAEKRLGVDLPTGKQARKPFHWPLVFPEVFQKMAGGFDAIVGNPPFMGGKKISVAMGTAYRKHLVVWLADGTKGSADLVAYFYLRAFSLLRKDGNFGLLAVNTIAEGETRKVGLERLVSEKGGVIYAAYPNEPWPGKAAVVTSRVHVRKGEWKNKATLSRRKVTFVSASLSNQGEQVPERLKINAGKSFTGSIVRGNGFFLLEKDASVMKKHNLMNEQVLFRFLTGKDLNSHPEQKPSRWVINFWDKPEEIAKKYEKPYQRILEEVKPERQQLKPNGEYVLRKPLPQDWWLHRVKCPALYHAIGCGHAFEHHPEGWDPNTQPMERVLVISGVTKFCAFTFCPTNVVLSNTLKVVISDSYFHFSALNSNLHEVWARKNSSTLGISLRYNTSSAFATFPFPSSENCSALENLGKRYHSLRAKIMRSDNIGLTLLFNRFHSPTENDQHILDLRNLHSEIDGAMAKAYGWDELDLEHGFHEVDYLPENDRKRFTISESARIEVLHRLAALNCKRFNAEQAAMLGSKSRVSLSRSAASGSGAIPSSKPEENLFGSAVGPAGSDNGRGQS